MTTIFFAIPVGTRFECNGNKCIKQSSLTAKLVDFDKVFYFSGTVRVRIMGKP